ncbi:MAG: hypothetical protein O3C21_09675, partial [Verrucomicrobia bacterium]|nr:hypothetical protein [Verrucomicrobiota bacterium]
MSEPDLKEKKDSPWVIVNCPSCEKQIKLPKDKVGAAKFKCPLCSEKISVSLAAAAAAAAEEKVVQPAKTVVESASSLVSDPIDLMGQANPEIDEEDEKEGFLARIRGVDEEPRHLDEGEVMEKDGQQVVKRRRRVRKKKKADAGPNWESDSKDEDQSNRDEDSYVIDTEIDDEGNVVEVRRR